MKRYFCAIIIALIAICLLSCEDPSATTDHNSNQITTTPSEGSSSSDTPSPANPTGQQRTVAAPKSIAPKSHNCKVQGTLFEDRNLLWISEKEQLISIVADESTKDPDLGDSHRRLVVYETKECKPIASETMEVNLSPDYPYYLSKGLYEEKNQVVGTQGYDAVYLYDVANKQMLPKLTPKYLTEREAQDAQSGAPRGLRIWENHLFGFALDYGAFAFDLNDKTKIKTLLPTAEYNDGGNSLFFIATKDGSYQAIIPEIDQNRTEESFTIKPLFKAAKNISPAINKKARNNRYLIFKEKLASGKEASIAIDMKQKKLVDLPTEIATQKTQAILAWIKKNGK